MSGVYCFIGYMFPLKKFAWPVTCSQETPHRDHFPGLPPVHERSSSLNLPGSRVPGSRNIVFVVTHPLEGSAPRQLRRRWFQQAC